MDALSGPDLVAATTFGRSMARRRAMLVFRYGGHQAATLANYAVPAVALDASALAGLLAMPAGYSSRYRRRRSEFRFPCFHAAYPTTKGW